MIWGKERDCQVFTHVNCRCQKEELLRRTGAAAGPREDQPGQPFSRYRNRHRRGRCHRRGFSGCRNRQSGLALRVTSLLIPPKPPETQLVTVPLPPRMEESMQHKPVNNKRSRSAGFALFSTLFCAGQGLHAQSWPPAQGGIAAAPCAGSGGRAEPSPNQGSVKLAPFKKPCIFHINFLFIPDLKGFFSMWQRQPSSPEAEALN